MKLTDNIVNKVGSDKLLHFIISGWIVSEFKVFDSIIVLLIVALLILLLSIWKEKKADTVFDIKDIIWSTSGSLISIGLYFIKYLI